MLVVPVAGAAGTGLTLPSRSKSTSPLSTLGANTARDIGPYSNTDSQLNAGQLNAAYITDYSGMRADAVRKRMLLFGGGHGGSQETDIRVLDMRTLVWSSLYPPTPAVDMADPNNIDASTGRYKSTNHPTARHTYGSLVVRDSKLHVLATLGMPDHLGWTGNYWGGRNCDYDFDTKTWSFGPFGANVANTPPPRAPWDYTAGAVLDPVSRKILVVGQAVGGGRAAIWLYDPDARTAENGPLLGGAAIGCTVVHYPPNGKFYSFAYPYITDATGGAVAAPIEVCEISLDPNDFSKSTTTKLAAVGTIPQDLYARGAFAYDSTNRVIGGSPRNGTFYTFDPSTRAFTATAMRVEAGSSGVPNLMYQCLDFDADSGCYIFLQNDGDQTKQTAWAYRFAPGGPSGALLASPPLDLSVRLDFGGGNVATFSGSDAVDKGDYVGEFVRQKSYLCTNPSFPDWRVWFRSDADASGNRLTAPSPGWRDEIIVEYGRSTSGTPAHRLSSYVATIRKNGAIVHEANVPMHFWFARWRYQSSPRRVVRTPATLVARNWLPSFGTAGMFGGTGAGYTVSWPGPMGTPARPAPDAPFDPTMGNPGDHEQIGYLTESAASYALFGGSGNLTTVLTEGEWTGNWCICYRDDATGAMPSFRDLGSRFQSRGGAYNEITGALALSTVQYPNFVSPDYGTGLDGSHWYPCANMAWLLTDDPFFLESLQFGVNLRLLASYSPRKIYSLPGVIYPASDRGYAWSLRDVFLLAKSCPANLPTWLQPRSYWQAILDDNRTYSMMYVNSPARLAKTFRTWPRQEFSATWQDAWLSAVVGMGVQMGFTDWRPIFDWSIGRQIAMTNGTSGWNKQWPVTYGQSMMNNAAYYSQNELNWFPYTDTSPDPYTCTSWADAWAFYKSGGNGTTDASGIVISDAGWDGHTLMAQFYSSIPGAGTTYPMHYYQRYYAYVRSAIAIAKALGVPGADTCYAYLQTEIARAYANWGGTGQVFQGQARFSIDPTPSATSSSGSNADSGPNAEPTPEPVPVYGNYQGMWWNSPAGSESGWGINFAHQGDVIFATWFTYNVAGKPWWLSMTAKRVSDNVYTGMLYQTRGPAYVSSVFDSRKVSMSSVGQGTLTFTDANNATFSYLLSGFSQTKSITRQVFASPVPVCAFATASDAALSKNYQDIWWASPAGSESGWGLNITHQGNTIFATWFTYDGDGNPLWMSATATNVARNVYAGALYETTGPAFNAVFDSSNVDRNEVGSMTLTFTDGNNAIFVYSLGGMTQTKQITRLVFRSPGTVCA
jgi:hypothetical protein